jgi:thermitase
MRGIARLLTTVALIASALALCAATASADQYIVRLRAGNDVHRFAQTARWQMGAQTAIGRPGIGAVVVTMPAGQVSGFARKLASRPEVAYIEPDLPMTTCSTPDDPYFGSQYSHSKAQTSAAWDLWKPNASVTVAVIDTGVDSTHPDLVNKMVRNAQGAVDGYNALTLTAGTALDDHGHGTHCAGIAAAQINNGSGVAGVCGWTGSAAQTDVGTKILPVKCLDASGSGSSSNVADGIVWAADHGARILSLSVGGGSTQTLADAVTYAWSRGCLVVAAAGNSASSIRQYPAGYPEALAVAATSSTDTLASYTNYGSWVQTAAPGDAILSTLPVYATTVGVTGYGSMSGTSMATPFVAGEAALLLSFNPSLTNAQLKNLIVSNVDAYTPYLSRTLATGAGRVNVLKALVAAGASQSAPGAPGSLAATAGAGQVTLSWTSAANALSYNVKRSTTAGGPYTVIASGGVSLSYTDKAVVGGTTYYYVASATNAAGEGANSNEAGAKPTAVLPVAPTAVKASAGKVSVSLTWTQSTTAGITGNKVYRSTTSGGPYTLAATLAKTTKATITGLTKGVKYYFRVTALVGTVESAYSAEVSATPR